MNYLLIYCITVNFRTYMVDSPLNTGDTFNDITPPVVKDIPSWVTHDAPGFSLKLGSFLNFEDSQQPLWKDDSELRDSLGIGDTTQGANTIISTYCPSCDCATMREVHKPTLAPSLIVGSSSTSAILLLTSICIASTLQSRSLLASASGATTTLGLGSGLQSTTIHASTSVSIVLPKVVLYSNWNIHKGPPHLEWAHQC